MQRNFPVPHSKNANSLLEKEMTDKVIGAAIEVHKVLGPGLLDSAYQVHEAQLLTYMRLTGIHVGLLINFNVPVVKDGIYRRVL